MAIVRTHWILEPFKDFSLEVFDSPRGEAVPLPSGMFIGPNDRRYEYRPDLGHYVAVTGT